MTDYSTIINSLNFDENGLIPAIAQQYDSGEVLMLAWMNAESIKETLQSGQVCYFSRSRNKLWRKGETSGQFQLLRQMFIDCDNDTILLKVDQKGVACHTGRRSCFFNLVKDGRLAVEGEIIIPPEELYK